MEVAVKVVVVEQLSLCAVPFVNKNKPPTTRLTNAKRNNGYQTAFPEFLEVLKKVLRT